MEGLTADELTIAFVGDTSESGLVGNNMLEISARGVSRRVALAEFDLVNRTTGHLSVQAAVLLGCASGRPLWSSVSNNKKISRIRKLLSARLGVRGDPFESYRPKSGWLPRFKVFDRRGAADERARLNAQRRTVSIEQSHEIVPNETGNDESEDFDNDQAEADDFEKEDDNAQQWIDSQKKGRSR